MTAQAPAPSVDVAVIGAGIVGLSCAWWLRESGASVLIADPAPGTGHSTGAGRMFRHAHRNADHAALATRASGLWDVLAERLPRVERPLLARIGALHTMPDRDGLAPLESALGACEVAYEILGPDDVRRRWPGYAVDPPAVLFDPAAGRIEAAAAIAGLRDDLRDVLVPMRVERLSLEGRGVLARSGDRSVRARAVVVCAGLETRHLGRSIGIDIRADRPLAATRLTFACSGEAPALPCIHERSGRLGERIAYLFPGEWGGVSIGLESLPELLTENLSSRIGACLTAALPGYDWRRTGDVAARLEVLDDDDHDRIELHRVGPVWAIAGWNLFKHAPAIGEGLADLIQGRRAPLLEPLAGTRSDRTSHGERRIFERN